MGWLVYKYVPNCIRDEIARLCSGESDESRSYPVLISRRGSVWYAAVRYEPKNGQRPESGLCPYGDYVTDATGGYVFGAIFLTSTRDGRWGYKSMDETAGPTDAAAQAPEKLLSLLSQTTNELAQNWRDRCRRYAAHQNRALKVGDVIRLEQPLRFTDGAELDTFRVAKARYGRRNRTVFISTENGGTYGIANIKARNWTHV